MRRMFLLVRLMLRSFGSEFSGEDDASGQAARRRRRRKIASRILFAFLALYMLAISTAMTFLLFDILEPVGLTALLPGLAVGAGTAMVFLFGIFYVMSVYFFSSDIERLLPLPILPHEIVGAKFLTTLVYEYLFLVFLVGPVFTIYGIRGGQPVQYYLYALVVFAFLPFVPLAMASLLVMVLMRVAPAARNKDRFNLFAGILVMVLALGFNLGIQGLVSREGSALALLLEGTAASIARITAGVFPGSSLAAAAIASPTGFAALGNLLLFLLIAFAAFGVVLLAGTTLYLRSVVAVSSASTSRRRMGAEELGRRTVSGSAMTTYLLKDLKILVRTPIFFMNNVLMNFLWPFFLLLPLFGASGDPDLESLMAILKDGIFTGDMPFVPLALAIAFAFFLFVAGTNGIAETCISREGRNVYIMKYIPMSYSRQVWSKVGAGVLLSVLGALVGVVFFVVVLAPPAWFVLLLLLLVPGAVLVPNTTGVLFDLYWPKVRWDNEQKAVKQNMNVLYGMAVSLLLAGGAIALVTSLSPGLFVTVLVLTLVPLGLSAAAAVVVTRLAPRLLRDLVP